MNPQGVQSFMQLLVRLNREAGIAILMIEHRVNELCKYFSRLAVMQDGRIVYDGLVKDAWQAMTGRTDLGLREPQTVKLCRALQLSELTTDQEKIVQMLRSECEPAAAAEQAKPAGQQQPLMELAICITPIPAARSPTLKNCSLRFIRGRLQRLWASTAPAKAR